MTDIIRLLPDSVANKIAAGEVIQRPASAAKELLENAIDSGASAIKLIVKDAGKTLIQVIDNGCGMSETDARMCFERHATSKIQKADDLFAIRTMGFRGEALASIAAISQIEIKTKRIEDELGTSIEIEGAEVKSQNADNCPNGTSIAVKNLFFNVPARRNFLKSNTAETRHIIEEFNRIALVNPQISFSMFHNNKQVFQLYPSTLKQRIIALFGNMYKQRLVPVEQKSDIVNISGFIGKPEFAKKTRGEQYFFANNRFIKHPYLNHSVNGAFKELLPADTYPAYFLYLEVDPKMIDVNIHPTKTEVNFQDDKLIYTILRAALKQSLGKYSITPTIDFDIEGSMKFPDFPKNKVVKDPSIKPNPDYNPFETGKKQIYDLTIDNRQRSNKDNWEKLFVSDERSSQKKLIDEIPDKNINGQKLIEPDWEQKELEQRTEKIFQIHNRYILSNIKSGLMIINQQRAHERILYERYLNMLNTKKGVSQQELFPQSISFSPGDAEIIDEIKEDLQILGFNINKLGKNTFVINGTPADLPEKNISNVLEKIFENYKNNLLNLNLDKKINLARSMASNMSIRSGKVLMKEEMKALVDELFACKVPDVSPGGKPIIQIISVEDLDKGFQ
ncbi:MAG: DNA mismatch repair endonuclease MutL [Bacteroidales bacterium]|nr:DNA mismatch repair endonuclease MutL [Bacteroidales bacterium]